MRATLIALAVVFVLFICASIPFLIWPPGLVLGVYKIEDRVDVPSPDNQYIASGYHFYGAAFQHDSTIFQIRRHDVGFYNKQNDTVCIVDMTGTSKGPDSPFSLSWNGNRELVITYTAGSVYLKKESWNDIAIKYVQK